MIDYYKSLEYQKPDIAKQWHPTRNGSLTPRVVAAESGLKVWWLLQYDDVKTGKHFDFEWQSYVYHRKSSNCPFLIGKAVWPGFNDLETVNPELAAQWHPQKNGNLTPQKVTASSREKVWWLFPYDDKKSGKHFDFEWQATVAHRKKTKCPFLTGTSVWPGFNDLETVNPELAAQWHPQKNGNLTPQKVTTSSNEKVWWLLPYDDKESGKHFDFEWQAVISSRRKNGCPYLSGKAVWPGFNDLETVNPELAAQWHPQKNGNLTPQKVTLSSGKKVWWLLPYDDKESGKHFDFEWQSSVNLRSKGNDCPYLSGKAVWPGFNDLATVNPELAVQWHPQKNGSLLPEDVTPFSKKKVWWLLQYKDVETGKHFDFEWQANVDSRTKGSNCPFLSGRAVWPGFNDLKTVNPELAAQWHPTKNGSLTPQNITSSSSKKIWWLFPYDDKESGKHFDFEWQATVAHRKKTNCPFLTGKAVWPGFNDLETVNPELAAQWHPTKNGSLTPQKVTSASSKKIWWLLPYNDKESGKHFDFEWKESISNRLYHGCPYLSNQAVWTGYNDLATKNPDLARQWHPEKNRNLTPQKVTSSSEKKVWWVCPKCHKSYRCRISERSRGRNCKCCNDRLF